uniref:Uncharacterized protein n=1 Tax=Avena sativa TaxID=4498 RepID=A0ACD5YG44_AVESA
MDTTKPMVVATESFNVKIWKDLEKKEDAMATVELAATSKKPSDQAANNINPLLLQSARVGSWEALKLLLEREDAKKAPMMIPTQEFLELLARGSNAHGKAAARDRDEEEGADADHQPPAAASPAAGAALLKGVTPDGDTALHAVARNRKGGQHFLRYAGIIYDRDPGLLFRTNQIGDTPLHCAARAGNSKMVSHLMDLAGREGAHTKLISLLRMENKRHETALHEAVRFQDGRVLLHKDRAALLAHDAVDPAAGEGGNNKDDEKNIVKLLMGVDPDLANYPARGISPLYLAILLGKSTIAVTLYHRSGGNLSYAGEDGQNVLHVAVLQETDTVIIEFLVHWKKTLITQVDKDGSTPLHFAASVFHLRPETLKILFKANRAALYVY